MSESFLFARGRSRPIPRGRGRGRRGRGLRKSPLSSSPEHAPSEKSESGSENNTIPDTSEVDVSSSANYSPKLQISSKFNLFHAFVQDGDEKEKGANTETPSTSPQRQKQRGIPQNELSLPPSAGNSNPWFKAKQDLNNETEIRQGSHSSNSSPQPVLRPTPPWQRKVIGGDRRNQDAQSEEKQDPNPNINKLHGWNKKEANSNILDEPINAKGEISDLLGNKRNRPRRKRQGKANELEALVPENPGDKTMLDTLLMDADVDDDILGADKKYEKPAPKNNVWMTWVSPKSHLGPNLKWVSQPKMESSNANSDYECPDKGSDSIESSQSEQSLEEERLHRPRNQSSKSRSPEIHPSTSALPKEKKSDALSVDAEDSFQIEERKADEDALKKKSEVVSKSLLHLPSQTDETDHLKEFDTRILEYLNKRRIEEQLWVINQLSKTGLIDAGRCREVKSFIESGNPQIDELFYMFKSTGDFSNFIDGINNLIFQAEKNPKADNSQPEGGMPDDMPKWSLSGKLLCTDFLLEKCHDVVCDQYHPTQGELNEIKRLNEVHFEIGQIEWMNNQDSQYPPRFQVCRHTRDKTLGPCRRVTTCYFCHWDFENPENMTDDEEISEIQDEPIDVIPNAPDPMYIPPTSDSMFQPSMMPMFNPGIYSPLSLPMPPPFAFSANGVPPMVQFPPGGLPKIVEIFHKPSNMWLYARVLEPTEQNGLRIQVIPPDPTHKTTPVVAPISECYPLGTNLPPNLPPGLLGIETKNLPSSV